MCAGFCGAMWNEASVVGGIVVKWWCYHGDGGE